MAKSTAGQLTKDIRNNFAGGVNLYLGPRQIKDNESPNATNCDFKGKGGIGSRIGYSEIGAVADSRTAIYGMAEYRTNSLAQLIKFASNGANVALYHSQDEGAWSAVTGTTFTDATNIDVVEAEPWDGTTRSTGMLFSFNGVDQMVKYDGTSWASHTGATKGFFGAYYDNRLWCVDETYLDTLNFSTKTPDATKVLDFATNGTSSNPGTVTILPGSGARITGLKVFKNKLYIFLSNAVYRLSPASTANTFTVELVTNSIGCVAHRSIAQVGEDLFFAGDNGIYSLGDVGTYTDVRTANKSARVQRLFDALTGPLKAKLSAVYSNFKYHLFYSLYGTNNDSCIPYDIRYQAWQDWRNMAANSATLYTNTTKTQNVYFGTPNTGQVFKMYDTVKDAGALITSEWYSKSFDEDEPDTMKLFLDSTFIFAALNGTTTVAVIFDDSEVSSSATLTQQNPQGGFGRDAFGVQAFGDNTNTVTVTQIINSPQRMRAKGQKFAVQYRITSTGQWQLDAITQTLIPFGHYKFPAANKLN